MHAMTTSPLRSRLTVASSGSSYQVWFPLTVYAITRLADLVLILVAARHQVDLPKGGTYGSLASNWDGQWYLSIATHGYPTTIPRDPGGHTLQNPWGFYPAYPAPRRKLRMGATTVKPSPLMRMMAPTMNG